jgi:membrane-bound ClpP family serine protease
LLTWKTIQLRRAPARTGLSAMVGESARIVRGFGLETGGTVQARGEYWNAVGSSGLEAGETVRIVRIADGVLYVERRNG